MGNTQSTCHLFHTHSSQALNGLLVIIMNNNIYNRGGGSLGPGHLLAHLPPCSPTHCPAGLGQCSSAAQTTATDFLGNSFRDFVIFFFKFDFKSWFILGNLKEEVEIWRQAGSFLPLGLPALSPYFTPNPARLFYITFSPQGPLSCPGDGRKGWSERR